MPLTPQAAEEFRLLVSTVQPGWREAGERAAEREANWYPETSGGKPPKTDVEPTYRAVPRF